jgi:hypothetical protein
MIVIIKMKQHKAHVNIKSHNKLQYVILMICFTLNHQLNGQMIELQSIYLFLL